MSVGFRPVRRFFVFLCFLSILRYSSHFQNCLKARRHLLLLLRNSSRLFFPFFILVKNDGNVVVYCLRTFLATRLRSSRFLAISSKLGGTGKVASVVVDQNCAISPTVDKSLHVKKARFCDLNVTLLRGHYHHLQASQCPVAETVGRGLRSTVSAFGLRAGRKEHSMDFSKLLKYHSVRQIAWCLVDGGSPSTA